jgi:L-iditol 2-dehydrogenase
MKVARYLGPGRLALEDAPVPEPGDGEVLVRVRACGVCGTDVKTYLRGHALIGPGSVLGHEVAGEVAVSHHPGFRVGDRVAVGPYAECGDCDACRRGHPSLCARLHEAFAEPGGFGEYVRVPRRLADRVMHVLPDALPYERAALVEPLACCVHGLRVAGVTAASRLLVIGDGPMGLLQAALARAWGVTSVLLAGATPHRLAFARGVADRVVDATREDLAAAVADWAPSGPDAALVSVASVASLADAIALSAKGGVVNAFAGMPRGEHLPLDLRRVHYDEVRVAGSFGYGSADFREAFDLLAAGALPLDGFVTDHVALEDVEAALLRGAEHAGIKTVVVG